MHSTKAVRRLSIASLALLALVAIFAAFRFNASSPGSSVRPVFERRVGEPGQEAGAQLSSDSVSVRRLALEHAPSSKAGAAARVGELAFLDAATAEPVIHQQWVLISGAHELEGGNELEVTSDTRGLAEVSVGSWRLRPVNPNLAITETPVIVHPGVRTPIWVARKDPLSVLVIDAETDVPIEGARVQWSPPLYLAQPDLPESEYVSGTTNERGRVSFETLPGALSGRLIVARNGYYPCQTAVLEGNAVMEVRLRRASAHAIGTIRCFDSEGLPIRGVVAFADPSNEWSSLMPVSIGTTDDLGTLALEYWMLEAALFRFGGAAYPCEYDLPGTGVEEGTTVELVLPRPRTGQLEIYGVGPGTDVEVFVAPAKLQREGVVMCPVITRVAVDEDSQASLALPGDVEAWIQVRDDFGRMATGNILVDRDGWKRRVELDWVGDEQLLLIPHGGVIESVKLRGPGYIDVARVSRVSERGSAVWIPYDEQLRSMEVVTEDGRSTLLSRRPCSEGAGSLDVHFPHRVPVELQVIDGSGVPVQDVSVMVRPTMQSWRDSDSPFGPRPSADGCWVQRAENLFRGQPGLDGVVWLDVPPGQYEVIVSHLWWREALPERVETWLSVGRELVVGDNGALSDVVVVARPRRIEFELRSEGPRPRRWILRDAGNRDLQMVVEGDYAEVWMTEEYRRFQVVGESGERLGEVEVPRGSGAARIGVQI